MILVTVGMQLPFPRFVAIMDTIAGEIGERVVGQIGTQGEPVTHMEALGQTATGAEC